MIGKTISRGIFLAVLAAALYAISAPFSKILLEYVPSTMMAGLLYIGAGIGMGAVALFRKGTGSACENRITKEDLPYTAAMILLDIAAPICLLFGLNTTEAANASLLNNFEIVATALIALAVFREKISPRLWSGIIFVTASCALLSFEDFSAFRFSEGSFLILLACVFWGIENNCTRKLSEKDPLQIVLLKGVFSGGTSLCIALLLGEKAENFLSIIAVLMVGCVAYGMSIFVYIHAQRLLGAARTSAYYAAAPFIGVLFSVIIFREIPGIQFFAALVLMAFGAWLSSSDKPLFKPKNNR